MLKISQAYKERANSNTRESYIALKYGDIFDFINLSGSIFFFKENNFTSFSNEFKLFDEDREKTLNYISCEPNRIKLDGNAEFIIDKTKSNKKEKIAYWSTKMPNNINSNLEEDYPTIKIIFDKTKFINFTFYFQEVCSDFTVYWGMYENPSLDLEHKIEIKDNKSLVVIVRDYSIGNEEHYFDAMKIVFKKTKEQNRTVKLNEIDFGIYNVIHENDIEDLSVIQETDIICETLPLNSCEITLINNNKIYDPLNPNNKIDKIVEGKQIGIYHYLKVGNKWVEKQIGFFNIDNIQNDDSKLRISCTEKYPDGLYYGSNLYINEERISVILRDFFSYFNYYTYELDPKIDDYETPSGNYTYGYSGYVPVVEFREALRLICEAGCLSIKKKKNGILYITKRLNLTNEKFDDNNCFNIKPKKNEEKKI